MVLSKTYSVSKGPGIQYNVNANWFFIPGVGDLLVGVKWHFFDPPQHEQNLVLKVTYRTNTIQEIPIISGKKMIFPNSLWVLIFGGFLKVQIFYPSGDEVDSTCDRRTSYNGIMNRGTVDYQSTHLSFQNKIA